MPTGHLYVFFAEMSVRSSADFLIGLLGFFVTEFYGLFVYFGN